MLHSLHKNPNFTSHSHSHHSTSFHFPFTPFLNISSPNEIPFTYKHFPNLISETLWFERESRQHLCRQLVPEFYGSIDQRIFTSVYCFVPTPNFPIISLFKSSMLLVTCPNSFPCPFSPLCFEEGANASYLSTLRQCFPVRLTLMICKFSPFLLHQVKREYLLFPVQISTRSSIFKNGMHQRFVG